MIIRLIAGGTGKCFTMTIDRIAVKQNAKEIIRTSKPSLITAGLIFTLLAVLINFLSLRLTGVAYDDMVGILQASSEGRAEAAMQLMTRAMPTAGESLIDLLLHLALSVVSVGFTIFTLNTIRKNAPDFGNLLDGFGLMPRLLWLLILESIFVMLWSLLFVIPGIVAAYRYSLAVYIMIDHPELSAMDCIRESKRMREELLHCGISQISGGSRTSVGGYTTVERHNETAQFDVSDTRPLDEVVRWLLEQDHIPSFCTACYRAGRTGDRFMSLCKSGKISLCCTPNALMTLKEYLMDYASPETRAEGERMIGQSLTDIPEGRTREITIQRLKQIEDGERDFRF